MAILNAARLVIEPRKALSKEEFCSSSLPDQAIALDGFVSAAPFREITPRGYRLNFDHHEGCERLATRSTSGQVLMALKLGLAKSLDGAVVYVNDCDQDVCLATWLLTHPQRVVDTSEPLLNKLIWAEDALDVTGGAYPFSGGTKLRSTLHWIFQPYESVRYQVSTMTDAQMRNVIEAVWRRIDDYLVGAHDEIELDPYARHFTWCKDVAPSSSGVAFVHEYDVAARQQLARQGYAAFVAIEQQGDFWFYKLGVLDPFAYFPLRDIYTSLQAAERTEHDEDHLRGHSWGGSDLIGGGPRCGSVLPPSRVAEVVLSFRNAVAP